MDCTTCISRGDALHESCVQTTVCLLLCIFTSSRSKKYPKALLLICLLLCCWMLNNHFCNPVLLGKVRVGLTGQCLEDWRSTMKPPCSKRSSSTGATPGKRLVPPKSPTTKCLIRKYGQLSRILQKAASFTPSLLTLSVFPPGSSPLWPAQRLRRLTHAPLSHQARRHPAGRHQRGPWLRPGGGGGLAELWD